MTTYAYNPGDQLQNWPDKSAEKVLWKVPAPNGVPRKVPKKCFRLPSLCRSNSEARSPKHLFDAFVGPGLRHFCGSGRQDCEAINFVDAGEFPGMFQP